MLPLFGRSFGVSYGAAGLLISAWALARLASDLATGRVLEWLGSRRVGAFGLCLTGCGALSAASVPSFPAAAGCWALAGVGSAFMFAAFYSVLLRSAPSHHMARTLGLFYASMNVGLIGGGAVGGVLASAFGLRAPLFAYACLTFLGAGVYIRLASPRVPQAELALTATPDSSIGLVAKGTLRTLLHRRGLMTVMFVNLVYMWAIAAVFDTLLPFFVKDRLHLSTSAVGALYSLALVGELVALFPAAHTADHRGRKVVLLPSLVALAVATALLGWTGTTLIFAAGLLALGAASGCVGVAPAAMLSDLQPAAGLSAAIARLRFFGDFGLMIGPAVAGYALKTYGFGVSFTVIAAPIFAVALAVNRSDETLARSQAAWS